MIVRTYGRRNRGISRDYSDTLEDSVVEPFGESGSRGTSSQDLYSLPFPSQESSSHWPSSTFDFDSYDHNPSQEGPSNGFAREPKKAKTVPVLSPPAAAPAGFGKSGRDVSALPPTSTLMEAQEFGEMMEHLDEVNFALDGLRKGQPFRIRRASLLSVLGTCSTAPQRRLLRTHGLAKRIIDAVLDLDFDDSPSNLAAATLFYVLTCDGQDDHLLETPSCINFLIKFLKPIIVAVNEDKYPRIGCRLLALRKGADTSRDTTKTLDSSSDAIFSKVEEVLVSCKEIKSYSADDTATRRHELNPKWIALLTMEKACISTISLEDTSGTVRKTGGNFKEKLREFGGLDAVFEVTIDCLSVVEGWSRSDSSSKINVKDDLESLVLLLKCLKIMENATFLSADNQSHLLGLKGNFHQGSLVSFIEVVLQIIKILSGLYLTKYASAVVNAGSSCSVSDKADHSSGFNFNIEEREDGKETILISSSKTSSSLVNTASDRRNSAFLDGKSHSLSNGSNFDANKKGTKEIICISSTTGCSEANSVSEQNSVSHRNKGLSTSRLGHSVSSSETTTTSSNDAYSGVNRVSSSTSGSCSGTTRKSNGGTLKSKKGYRKNRGMGGQCNDTGDAKFKLPDDSGDPFAFIEDDKPSKWELLSKKGKKPQTQKSGVRFRENDDDCQLLSVMGHQESIGEENRQELRNRGKCQVHETSPLSAVDFENSGLMSDCLLTAVKVLMNLTNDNPVGCQQIAAFGGLEALSSLIACHFPKFSSSTNFRKMKGNNFSVAFAQQDERHLSDQELDFLVAILGLLVNLVEKDGFNRSRLASASVSLHASGVSEEENQQGVIPLLCSIFLANQGAGEAAVDGNTVPWNDEAAVLEGEKEAEKMIIEAYAALLLAFLSTESRRIRDAIAECLPERKLAILVPVLERFVVFHLTLNMISPETHKAVSEVIESCRMP